VNRQKVPDGPYFKAMQWLLASTYHLETKSAADQEKHQSFFEKLSCL